jgi:tetratricopeptide (TPR) repeat protein
MRKINGKLLVGLLLGTAVLCGAVYGVHYFQYQRIARAVLWQARRAEDEGKLERMARYLERYLEFNPKDDGEKAHLARTWAGESFAPRTRTRAMRLLEEVVNRDDGQAELRRLLVKTALDLYQLKTARDHLRKLLPFEQVRDPQPAKGPRKGPANEQERGEIEGLWGRLLEAEKKPAEAILCCDLAVQHAPQEQGSYVRLAYLLRRTPEADKKQEDENLRKADRVIDKLVANNPTSYQSYLSRWRYRRDFGLIALRAEDAEDGKVALKDAAEDVAQALKREPKAAEVHLAMADVERLEANQVAEDRDLDPKEREKRTEGHRQEAYKHLQRGLALAQSGTPVGDGAQFQLLWHKASLLLDDIKRLDDVKERTAEQVREMTAKEAEAAQTVGQLRKAAGAAAADFLQGRLLAHQRRWAEAATLFEQARALMAAQPDLVGQINLHLGQCYEKLEEPVQMYDAYRQAAQADPTSVPAQLGMAAALWAQGRLDEAAAKYRQMMDRKVVPVEGWLDIARLELQRQLQSSEPPDWKLAEQALKLAEKATPASADVVLLRADLLAAQNRLDRAEELLKQKTQERPKQVELWTALSDLYLRRKEGDKARAVLEEARNKLGDQVRVRLAWARYVVATEKHPAKPILSLADGAGRFSEEDQARLLSGLADAQFRADNLGAAYDLWHQLSELPSYRTNLRLRLLLFDLTLKLGNEKLMQQSLDDIRQVERSSGVFHRYGEALRLIWRARKADAAERTEALARARLLLNQVLSLRDNWPPVYLARAEVADLQGNPEQAIADLKAALEKGETSPAVLRRLADLLHRHNRAAEADQALGRLPQGLLREQGLGRLAADVAQQRGDLGRALQIARDTLNTEATKDPRDLVWLGRLLAAANKPAEAEPKLRRAVELAPEEPETWVALAQFLAARKRRDDALAALGQAREKVPAGPRPLALARCYEALGETEQARKQYEEALKARPDDMPVIRTVTVFYLNAGRVQDAEPLLGRVAEGKVKASPEDVAWARRGLAIVLANGTDYRRFRKALELVGLQLDSSGQLVRESARDESTDTVRTKARVLATQGQQQFRRRAIELLEGLAAAQALTPDDQYVLALLYDADGSWPNAQEKLRDLALRQGQVPRYLARYAHRLIQRGEFEEAQRWIDQLTKLEEQRGLPPNTYASVELQARLMEVRDRDGGEKALELLRKHVGRRGAGPDEVFLVLQSLQRQRRFGEAFTQCEKVWDEKKCAPEATGGMSVALLRGMTPPPTDAQVRRVERRLKDAIAANPKSTVLLMHLSDLYDMRGRYRDAEEQYRKILAQEPGNMVALNNLAWLLAQRSADGAAALEYVTAAINGLGRRADLLDTRGLVHLALNQPDKAVADLKAATAEAPTPTRLFHLARAYYLSKDRSAAAKVLTEARDRHGLKLRALHPIEQETCQRLGADLNVKLD